MMFKGLMLDKLIRFLHGLPPEFVWVLLLLVCFSSILILLRLFGALGMHLYIGIAIVAANIQVLKAVQFSVLSQPVALGTILFSSVFLCTDILTEYYGAKEARKGVYIGLAAMILMTVFMILGIGFRPLQENEATEGLRWAIDNHNHMVALFMPTPALLIAGMIAYFISQLHDIWSFTLIKKLTGGKFLWLRNNIAMIFSSFIDNVIFSVLAWVVFAQTPIEWRVLWFTYILGTFALRVVVAILDTPIVYIARYFIKDHEQHQVTSKATFSNSNK